MTNVDPHRAALFVPSLRGGGTERVFLRLAEALTSYYRHVDLVVLTADGPYRQLVPSEVRLVELKRSRMLTAIFALARYLHDARPASLLTAMSHCNIAALLAVRLQSAPTKVVISQRQMVTIAHGKAKLTPWQRTIATMVPIVYRYADAIVANSDGVANDLQKQRFFPLKPITVIPNPIALDDLVSRAAEHPEHPWVNEPCGKLVVAVGRLHPQKGFDTLIKAFAALRLDRPIRLLILGEGGERKVLEKLIDDLNLGEKVALPGFMINPYCYVARADLFVLSSRYEGSPNALAEAMALGTPVLSTDCPSGPAELLEGGRLAPLVPIDQPEAMAEAMEHALETRVGFQNLLQDRVREQALPKIVERYAKILRV